MTKSKYEEQFDLLSEKEYLLEGRKRLLDKELHLVRIEKIRIKKKIYNRLMKTLRKMKYSPECDHVEIIKKTYPVILFQVNSLNIRRSNAIKKVADYLYYDISFFGRILRSNSNLKDKK